jgi:hypothetical protein
MYSTDLFGFDITKILVNCVEKHCVAKGSCNTKASISRTHFLKLIDEGYYQKRALP